MALPETLQSIYDAETEEDWSPHLRVTRSALGRGVRRFGPSFLRTQKDQKPSLRGFGRISWHWDVLLPRVQIQCDTVTIRVDSAKPVPLEAWDASQFYPTIWGMKLGKRSQVTGYFTAIQVRSKSAGPSGAVVQRQTHDTEFRSLGDVRTLSSGPWRTCPLFKTSWLKVTTLELRC